MALLWLLNVSSTTGTYPDSHTLSLHGALPFSGTAVDGVIAVVDGPAVADGLFAGDPDAVAAQRAGDDSLDHDTPLEELFEEQLGCADMVVINQADLLDEARLAEGEADRKSVV